MGTTRNTKRLLAATLTVAALAGGAMAVHADTFSQRAVATSTATPTWPVAVSPTCTSACSIDLNVGAAKVNVKDTTLPAGSQDVDFWGFGVNTTHVALAGAAASIIKVPAGTKLDIHLHQASGTGSPIDLTFPSLKGTDVVRDTADPDHYTVTPSEPGTSVFQPGTLVFKPGTKNDAPRQIAMGLVGVLIVTPTDCTDTATNACAFTADAYQDEAVVATTTLDYDFAHDMTIGATPDMAYFGTSRDVNDHPRQVYHLINGQAFPDTQVIDARAGDKVLLRYVNASVFDKSLGLLGLRQTLLGRNASPYVDPQTFIAPLIGPGETADVAVAIPADAVTGQRYSLMDQGRQMNHGDGAGFGGALTFINVWATPTVIGLAYDFQTGLLSGTASPSAPAFPVQQVAWSTDNTNWNQIVAPFAPFSAGVSITADSTIYVKATDSAGLTGTAQLPVAPGSPSVSGLGYDLGTGYLSGTVAPSSPLFPLTSVVYSVNNGTPTAVGEAVPMTVSTNLNDKVTLTAPSTITVTVTDSLGKTATASYTVTAAAPVATAAQGASAGSITATGTATAGLTITAAEYFVGTTDPGVGGGTAITTGTFDINAVTDLAVTGLTSGDPVSVRVQDSFGQWGPVATVTVP